MVDSLFPARCAFCAAPGAAVCAPCRAELPWNEVSCPRCARPQTHDAACGRCAADAPVFDAAWTGFVLGPPVQQQIHRLKYRGRLLEAALLGQLLAPRLPSRPDLIIPVPLHGLRLLRRGYNQAAELARWLSRLSGLPADAGAARRLRATEDQVGKTAAQRRRNLKGAFVVERDLGGLEVALLDDVMTTGTTLAELSKACRRAGAARVEAWAVARTP